MIVWLASFPRSGNTLLRTILKQTIGLGSYSDELVRVGLTEAAKDGFGHLPMTEPWESFYGRAMSSEKKYLVKTHLPPRDDQPTIYVVRDGRHSLASYREYHKQFLGEQSLSQLALVLGADYYGGWSEHYKNWISDGRKTLLLRYEDLVNASPELVRSIAQFIGHDGPISEWSNPFDRLHKENPEFFRVGEISWQGATGWSELINGVFFLLHGDLMNMLGYADREGIEKARAALTPELIELIQIVQFIRRQNISLGKICQERLAVINVLDAEVRRLNALNGKLLHSRKKDI